MNVTLLKQKAGTTNSWQRPTCPEIRLANEAWHEIDLLKLLVDTRMAQSIAEARRIVHDQNIVWIDEGFESPHGWTKEDNEFTSSILTRLKKIKDCIEENGKTVFVKIGMIIAVGKRLDDAVCHRITFVQEKGWNLVPLNLPLSVVAQVLETNYLKVAA